jgi:RNA polymerase sigma-70 factor, ECF subfamily
MTEPDSAYDPISERPRLIRLAYRLLGSVTEAEDVVQDAYLRFAAQATAPRSPPAWLTTVTTRLAIDRLRRIKARRETYPGPWLPDPIATEPEEDTGDLSIGFLLMLERLSPEERAAFTLREGFDTPYSDIAAMLDKTETTVRQIVSRARARLHTARPAAKASRQGHLDILNAFAGAVASGDIQAVKALLAADIRLVTDGGGRRSAALRVVKGPDEAASLMHFLAGRGQTLRALRITPLNCAPAIFAIDDQGDPFSVQIETNGATIFAVYVVRNPEKLGHLIPGAAH